MDYAGRALALYDRDRPTFKAWSTDLHLLHAIGNREWLWQRPYTNFELQHRWDRPTAGHKPDSGFLGVGLNGAGSGPALLGPGSVPIELDSVDSGAGDG